MTMTTTTNDKQQATIDPWPLLTMKHRKQRLGNGKSIMTVPIESGGNNIAVGSVGNCIMARAHCKQWQCSGFSNSVTVQQLWICQKHCRPAYTVPACGASCIVHVARVHALLIVTTGRMQLYYLGLLQKNLHHDSI